MPIRSLLSGMLYIFSLTVLPTQAQPAPTFAKDVAPILQSHCQICHRPGEAAPFSLLTYEQARPWAKAIKEAVLQRKMPPWFADPHYGKFSNDSSLPAEGNRYPGGLGGRGRPEGNPKDTAAAARSSPTAGRFPNRRGDRTAHALSRSRRPATIEYQHILIPAPFKTDKWVQFAEARPTDRARVHHIIAFIREPGSDWLKEAKPGIPFVPEKPKRGRQQRYQPAAQRFSGRLRARPAAREVSSRGRRS